MADKKISDFTAVTSLGTGDLFELETAAGNSRKITEANLRAALGAASGTSFPGSPASGDRYFRTDLGFDCYYDGTRWLTVEQYTIENKLSNSTNYTGSITNIDRSPVPNGDTYSIYVEKIALSYIIVGTSNWTVVYNYNSVTGSGSPTGSFGSGVTVSTAGGGHYYATTTINAVFDDVCDVDFNITKNSGTGTFYPMPSIIYRLVVT